MSWYVVKYSMIHVACIKITQIIQLWQEDQVIWCTHPSSAKITFRHALPSKPGTASEIKLDNPFKACLAKNGLKPFWLELEKKGFRTMIFGFGMIW